MTKLQETALVIEHEQVAQLTHRLKLQAPGISRSACAGQFAMIQVRQGFDPLLRRPLSFHRILPAEGCIELLYRVVGRGTWWLSQAKPGTAVSILGPLGNGFTPDESAGYPVALIAGGIGIAPLFQLLLNLVADSPENRRENIHLFYGARTAAELLPEDSFDLLGIPVHVSTDDGSRGFHGRVTQLFASIVEGGPMQPRRVFACGPLAMQVQVAKWVVAHGTASQLSLEALMACGVGACLGCALPAVRSNDSGPNQFVHVCKDGPIFQAGSIEWTKIQPHPMPTPTFLYS
jgi:dihydroorotate dehydrogenase electron transfer subunit